MKRAKIGLWSTAGVTVVGGEGRFEGATGTWVGTAESQPTARVTAEVSVDLD